MGTRKNKWQRYFLTRDHPHAYGDKLIDCQILDYCVGSSPRVWGQEYPLAIPPIVEGIIPTRMGTSGVGFIGDSRPRDHPHAYGDKTKLSYRLHTGTWIIPTRMGTSVISIFLDGA